MYEELEEFGFSENEIKIYVSLLTEGPLSPSEIAKITGLHRSYIYDTLERLMEKGFVNVVYEDNKKLYQASNPKIIKKTYEMKLSKLEEVIDKLYSLYQYKKDPVHVEIHKGSKVYRRLIKNILSEVKQKDIVRFFGVNEELIQEIEPIYLRMYFDKVKDLDVRERIIIKKGMHKIDNEIVEYKERNIDINKNIMMVVFNDKVYYFTYGNPSQLILIESKAVAEQFKLIFDYIWNIKE